jgi:hypothetical protein
MKQQQIVTSPQNEKRFKGDSDEIAHESGNNTGDVGTEQGPNNASKAAK